MTHQITTNRSFIAIVIAGLLLIVALAVTFGAAVEDGDVFVPSWQYPVSATVIDR